MSKDDGRTFGQGREQETIKEVVDYGISFKPFDSGYQQVADSSNAKPFVDTVYVPKKLRDFLDRGPIVVKLYVLDSDSKRLKLVHKLPDGSYELVDRTEDAKGYYAVEPTVQFPNPEKNEPNLGVDVTIGDIKLYAANLNEYAMTQTAETQSEAVFAGWDESPGDKNRQRPLWFCMKLEDLRDLELAFRSTWNPKNPTSK